MNAGFDYPWERSFSVAIPNQVEYGWGASARIAEIIPPLGRSCLVLTEVYFLGVPAVRTILDSLESAGCSLEIYTDLEGEAAVSSIDKASDVISSLRIDFIVAIGGGSVIDFGKACSFLIAQGGSAWDYVSYGGRTARVLDGKVVPLVAVPTTAGTGSEVTPYAVLVNQELGVKAAVISPLIIPQAALVDPLLTVSLPPEITASTGADALAQCIESYLNTPDRSPFSAMLSLDGIRAAANSLVRAVENPEDRDARSLMSWASLLGGLSISLVGTGLGHAVAELLGGLAHLPHGKAVALLLPAVLKVLEEDHQLHFPDLNRALGNPDQPAYLQIARLWKQVGLPLTAGDLKLDPELPRILRREIVDHAEWALRPNPVHFTADDLDRLLSYLWDV